MKRLHVRHVLCPVDFSSLATRSLKTAIAMARARKAELRALHVTPSEATAVSAGLGTLERQTLMSRLRTSLTEAAPSYDLVGAAVRQGDPAIQILRFARTMPADLIVMGAPGADRPERPMGPVTSVVVARSQCPVLTVPHHMTSSDDSGLYRRIVCAVDLAASSVGVIRQALSLAWETEGAADIRVCAARRWWEASRCGETEVVIATGTASMEIVRIAEEQNADLVVIGAPRRWTSTTHAVLNRSLCPVLVTHDARPLRQPPTNRTHNGLHTAV